VWTTKPYYRSTYALVYVRGRGLDAVKSGRDLYELPESARARLRIGIHDRSPASVWLTRHGMEAQARPYPMLSPDPDQHPGSIIERELASGALDAVVAWGPIAGYYAQRVKGAALVVIPLASEPGVKFDYDIAMGVRFGEREWKDTVERLVADNQPAIRAILREYGVPLVDERGVPLP
jgi:ABC-type amino acid transport substrate-binding protein